MNIEDLIEKLKQFPPTFEVIVSDMEGPDDKGAITCEEIVKVQRVGITTVAICAE